MTRMEISLPSGDRTVEVADSSDVVDAIRELAGDGEVWLGDPTVLGLGVTGGPTWFFLGFVDHASNVTLQALAAAPPPQDIEASVGSQPTRPPAKYLLPLTAAIAAANHFLLFSAADPAISWER